MPPITVLIVDDDRFALACMRMWLAEAADIAVVGLLTDGQQVLAAVAERPPQVVLLDVHMPGLGGLETARQLLHAWPQVGVIIVSGDTRPQQVLQAVQWGARGYVRKDSEAAASLVAAVRAVAAGHTAIDPQLNTYLLAELRQTRPPLPPAVELKGREQHILQLLVTGATNCEISLALHLSERTVKKSLTTLFKKLGVGDRVQATRYAVHHGLVQAAAPAASPPRASGTAVE